MDGRNFLFDVHLHNWKSDFGGPTSKFPLGIITTTFWFMEAIIILLDGKTYLKFQKLCKAIATNEFIKNLPIFEVEIPVLECSLSSEVYNFA